MKKYFIKIFDYFRKVSELNETIEILEASRDQWRKKAENPRAEDVLKKIIRRGIDWYSYNEIKDLNEKKAYYNDIQSVLKNESFINELNHLLVDQIEFIARESKDFNEVEKVRMTINAIDLIKDRLKSIYNPDVNKPTKENIEDPI